MKRAPIVLTGTACGLVAVIGYHTATPQASALTGAAGGAHAGVSAGGATSATGSSSGSSATTTTTASAGGSSATTASTAGPSGTRTAVGTDVQYPYGDVAVEVTMTGSRITQVAVVRHNTYDPRSAMIDQYAIPILRKQALSVQSARIDGISGASYTSAAYAQSLQSALDKLKA